MDTSVTTSTDSDDKESKSYYAHFEKDGEHIRISISGSEYASFEAGALGKEYIFYKLNNKTGNPWRAFRSELLEADRPPASLLDIFRKLRKSI